MKDEDQLQFNSSAITIPLIAVFLIWLVYWLEIKFGFNFNKYGVYPRSIIGFRGVFTSHFIHADTKHLFNNSVPLFVLLMSLYYFYRNVATKVLIIGAFLTGVITWGIGRESYHFGASGVVYLLFSFIFFSGIIKRHYRLIAMSLITIFLYGSMIWYLFPIKKGISWEGHLSGFIVGLLFAVIYRNKGINKEKYKFSETEFDMMFDDEGNYIPPPPIEIELNEEIKNEIPEINYKYVYKKTEE